MAEKSIPPIRMRVLVGRYEDDARPAIAGAMDEGIWEVTPDEDWEGILRKWKEGFSLDWVDYEWAEVVVEVSRAALCAVFDVRTLEGTIDG